MTIQEAINSGKPLRQSGSGRWFRIPKSCFEEFGHLALEDIESKMTYTVGLKAILATDWEIKTELVPFPIVVETIVPESPHHVFFAGDLNKMFIDHPGQKIRITVEAI